MEIVLPQDPAISFLGKYPKDAPMAHTDTCSIMYIEALFVIATNWKQVRCPSHEEGSKKMEYMYTMEYCS